MTPSELAPDFEIRERALDTARSFLVQAPAGSGKTELLIRRYLKLLDRARPESIIAITFTRKAAGEMRERVLDALRESGRHSGIVENPSRLRIQTIDSLCEWLSARLPVTSGLGGHFTISDDAEELYREAAAAALMALERGEPLAGPLRTLLLHLENDAARLRSLIVSLLGKRDQWLPLNLAPRAGLRAQVEGALRAAVESELRSLARLFPPARPLADWRALAEDLLTKDGTLRVKVAKAHPSYIGAPWIEALHAIRELPEPEFSPGQWAVLEAAIETLKRAVAELKLVFERRGETDFIEKSLRALAALGTEDAPTDLALALGDRVEHLLVDEMQDTSVTHLELIRRLTASWSEGDGRTLFLVGDPMQSVYLFREAEVGIFLDLARNGLNGLPLETLRLEANFRSQRGLVEWVNRVFPRVLGAGEDAALGAVPYKPSVAVKPAEDAAVHLHLFEKDNRAGEARRAADLAASLPGSTAILGRRREDLRPVIRELRRRAAAFTAVEMDMLGERPQVLDLMALVRTLLRPADRTAALAVLRGPWCGLTLEELHEISANPDAELSPEVRRVTGLVNEARAMLGRAELRYVTEHLWRSVGGPCFYPAERDQKDAATFFSMLAETEEGGAVDLARLGAKLKKLYGAPEQAPDLHLMTVHKAKGLQFDNVIVTGLGSMFRPQESNLLAWTRLRIEGEERILMGAISATGQKDAVAAYMRRFLSARERNERRRLLYVAATRARSQLHLLGCAGARGAAQPGSFLELLWPEFAGLPAEAKQNEAAENAGPRIRRVHKGWTPPAPRESLAWTPRIGGAASESKPTFEWAGDTMRHVGTAVHNWLHRIAREGLGSWDEDRVRASRKAISLRLANLGVPPDELRAAARRVEDALVNVLEDPRGRWILTRHAEDRREYAVSGFVDGKLYQAVVDCTFVDTAGLRWVIDFKSGYQEGGGVEHFLDEEQRRYAPQLARYARLLAQGGAVRAGLYFPLMRAWRSWEAGAVRKAT